MKPIKTLMTGAATIALLAGPALAQSTSADTDTNLNLSAQVNDGKVDTNADADAKVKTDSEMGDSMDHAADKTGDALETGADNTKQTAEAAGDAVEDGANSTMRAAGEATDKAGDKIKDGAAATADAIGNGVKAAGDKAEDVADSMGDNDLTPSTLTVGALLGAEVKTDNEDTIGEIDNVVTVNGKEMAVVGIGGFLGLGEHDVAVPLSDLSSDGENVWAKGYTKEQLKGMAEYDADAAEPVNNDEPVMLGKS